MRERWGFFTAATRRGWTRLRHPLENLSLLLALLAAFGLPTTLGQLEEAGWLGLAVGIVAGAAVVVLEGAFHLWHEIDEDDRDAAALRDACMEWCTDVERFMEVREAARPPVPSEKFDLAHRLRRIGSTNNPRSEEELAREREAQEAADAHDRTTVSLYIEKHRDRGAFLFDLLVRRGILKGREQDWNAVRSPKSKWQINEAARIVWLGGDSDLRRRSSQG